MSTINAQAGSSSTLSAIIQSSDGTANLALQTNGANAVVIDNNQNANFASTGAVILPSGTTNARPTGVNGMLRYNPSTLAFEVYIANAWANAYAAAIPISNTAPVVSGSTVVGSNLTCSTGGWTNSPTTYTYQWYANSTSIANATSNVITLTSSQAGANIYCNVVAYNPFASSPANSNIVGPVTSTYTVSYLIVAGGGGGGNNHGGGGGGAGGLLTGSVTATPGTSYSFTIGGGGTGGKQTGPVAATAGSNSTAFGLTAVGGGLGGGETNNPAAGSGGSGGGGAGGQGILSGGSGTAGQGNSGGNGGASGTYSSGGGGGGAGGAGSAATGSGANTNTAGAGGVGVQSSITGTAIYYAGGGGGGYWGTADNGGAGGSGGGGKGGGGVSPTVYAATAGTANTGGGGGGSRGDGGGGNRDGANGGSGVVIISMPTSSYSGITTGSPSVTTSGSNTILKYTSSGSYTA